MLKVCFVCLGNICRSPTAEGVFRHLVSREGLQAHFEIDSAGTAAYHTGEPADRRSAQAAMERGIQLTGKARRFEDADFARFDYILAMDRSNFEDLVDRAADPSVRAKVRLLRQFDPEAKPGAEVPDPYYGGSSGFEDVLDICERSCTGFLAFVRRKHGF